MSRPKGQISWHSSAISLQAGGASANDIVDALRHLPDPPTLAAVRKYLARAKADPVGTMQVMATAPKIAPVSPVLTEGDNKRLSALVLGLEEHRFRVLKKVFIEVEEFLDTDHRDIAKTQAAKFYGAVELLKALKAGGAVSEQDRIPRNNADIRDIRVEVVHVNRDDASPSP